MCVCVSCAFFVFFLSSFFIFLFIKRNKRKVWNWMAGEVRRKWEEMTENYDHNILYTFSINMHVRNSTPWKRQFCWGQKMNNKETHRGSQEIRQEKCKSVDWWVPARLILEPIILRKQKEMIEMIKRRRVFTESLYIQTGLWLLYKAWVLFSVTRRVIGGLREECDKVISNLREYFVEVLK